MVSSGGLLELWTTSLGTILVSNTMEIVVEFSELLIVLT